MTVGVFIDNNKIDLFKDESIRVTSSVLDISDITKNTTTFSKSFTVPSSNENDRYFKHYYNANIDNTFDARTKVDGHIELDRLPFVVGKWTLEKVNVKKKNPESYVIRFTGKLVDIKTKVKKDELKDLNLTGFDHSYDSANVLLGLESSTGLFSGGLVYNLFVKKQYYINSDITDDVQTPILANISAGGGPLTGVIWNDLRPSIKQIKIIEAIETDYNITFTRDFFGTAAFQNTYMWLNPDSENQLGGTSQVVQFDAGDDTWMPIVSPWIGSYEVSKVVGDIREFFMGLTITPDTGFEDITYTVEMYVDNTAFAQNEYVGTQTQETVLSIASGTATYSVYYTVKANQEFQYTASLEQIRRALPGPVFTTRVTTATSQTITSNFIISDNIPKIKIIDYLKGLFNMYKLVVVPQDNGDLYVNTLNGYYSEGTLYDVNKYIDFNETPVKRGTILNEISFKFQEPTTILNQQFTKNTGQSYGDEELSLEDANGDLLDGDSLTFTLPFEQIIYERLPDINDNVLSNVMYGAIIDENLDRSNPKAHIFYNENQALGFKNIAFIDDTGTRNILTDNINVPSHGNTVLNPLYSTIFGREFSEWDGVAIENTLYLNYYKSYIDSIFNIKKREFSFKAILPLKIITKLELNDVLFIDGNYFRINKFTTNLLSGETQLDLINSFDNSLGALSTDSESIETDYQAKGETISINNLDGSTINKVDLGDGTSWATITTSGNLMTITVTANSTPLARELYIEVTKGTDQLDIYFRQGDELYIPKLDFSDGRNSWQLSLLTLRA